ncbi:hypothetical protein ACFVU2_19910 [Leifsonia sp. NPDC058194]|uniref:hypothetical protein n=1 Tax=Leifsonia sp. NPDC058194 TaxID=3346374 RepID=UPI0036DB409C
MSTTTTAIIENAVSGHMAPTLPTASWDLISALANSKNYLGLAGGGLVTLLGLAAVVWAAVLIIKKFFGSHQNGAGEPWVKIILMIIVGGAMMTGGITLITDIASGGQKTIQDLGGGFIILKGTLGLGR